MICTCGDRPWSHGLAGAVGFVATGLHQIHVHPFFAFVFCAYLLYRRRWTVSAYYLAVLCGPPACSGSIGRIIAFWLADLDVTLQATRFDVKGFGAKILWQLGNAFLFRRDELAVQFRQAVELAEFSHSAPGSGRDLESQERADHRQIGTLEHRHIASAVYFLLRRGRATAGVIAMCIIYSAISPFWPSSAWFGCAPMCRNPFWHRLRNGLLILGIAATLMFVPLRFFQAERFSLALRRCNGPYPLPGRGCCHRRHPKHPPERRFYCATIPGCAIAR